MFKETIEKATDAVSNIQKIINNAINSAKESYEARKAELESLEGKENPEELLDVVKTYGGLIGMVDAGVYISQIEKDSQNATPSSYLTEVFKQFPIVEERFKKFINENQG